MNPFFSVIVPTYNRAGMLRTALNSVRGQTFQDWECLVVDDASTDGTTVVLKDFESDPRFRVFSAAKNQGMNASRNWAIGEARGEFVTFLDSDDLWLPERLAVFAERSKASPAAGFLFSNAYVWRYGRIIGLLFPPGRVLPEGVVPGHYAVGDRYLPYVTSNVAIRREAFQRWGLFRTEMRTLDTELFVRFLDKGLPVASIPSPLSVRRLHGAQLTDRYEENYEESMKALASCGASEDEKQELRNKVARETALYLIKAGRPAEARIFLEKTLGTVAAREVLEWRLSLLPAGFLRILRSLREWYLRVRSHPVFLPKETRSAARMAAALFENEPPE